MGPAALLAELTRRGVEVWAEGDRLRYRAPRGALPRELIEALRAHKAALVALLRDAPRGACYACGSRDWWRPAGGEWCCAVCHPPAVQVAARVMLPTPVRLRPARPPEPVRPSPPADPGRKVPRCERCGAEVAHWSVTVCQRCKDVERLHPGPLAAASATG